MLRKEWLGRRAFRIEGRTWRRLKKDYNKDKVI